MTETFVYVYKIRTDLLPLATKEMNTWAQDFKSRVLKIITESEETWRPSLVFVEINKTGGYISDITDKWKNFIEEIQTKGVKYE